MIETHTLKFKSKTNAGDVSIDLTKKEGEVPKVSIVGDIDMLRKRWDMIKKSVDMILDPPTDTH